MAQLVFTFDSDQPLGERLAPELREEIAYLAPSTLSDGGVTTPKIKDGAVTTQKIGNGAVTSPKIGSKEVKAVNLDDGAVGTAALGDGAVTDAKAGAGVVTAHDSDGAALTLDFVPISQEDWVLLDQPDPNTFYAVLVTGGE